MTTDQLTRDRLSQLMDADPEAGVFTWKVSRGRNAKPGQEAGFLKKNGYVSICIDQKEYYAHRLMWLYVHGSMPLGQIDHVDRDKTNNSIYNLRLATAKQNAENMFRDSTNTSGYRGVNFNRRLKSKPWSANITHNGRLIHLGYYATAEDASAARKIGENTYFTHHVQ
jgi:hypothetical protein